MSYIFRKELIPVDGDNRPGIKEPDKWSFTVHNTGLPGVPAINFAKNLARVDNDEEVGFHYVCDDKEVIQCIPDDEVAWHCANAIGNYHSLSLEVCEVPGAEDVAVEFLSDKFIEFDWGIDKLTTHQAWNGKYCPRLILPHWDKFTQRVLKLIQEKWSDKMKKIVTYLGDADLFAAVIVSQKNNCPLMLKKDYDESGINAEEEIKIGGKPNSTRFTTFIDAAELVK